MKLLVAITLLLAVVAVTADQVRFVLFFSFSCFLSLFPSLSLSVSLPFLSLSLSVVLYKKDMVSLILCGEKRLSSMGKP